MKNKSEIYSNVSLGKNIIIEPFCVIGKAPKGKKAGELKTVIGDNAIIRSGTVIYAGTRIGNDFQAGHGVLIREGNSIGDKASVGTNSMLEPDNKISNRVRIHSGCFMESAIIGDDVFIGPCVVLLDDPHPPCPRYKDCKGGVRIERFAKIGAHSTILPGIIIGEKALIGAGAVVTKDVLKCSVVTGNPAKEIKSIEALRCLKGFYKVPYSWQ